MSLFFCLVFVLVTFITNTLQFDVTQIKPITQYKQQRSTRDYALCSTGEKHDPNNAYAGISYCCSACIRPGSVGEFVQMFTPDQIPWRFTDVNFIVIFFVFNITGMLCTGCC